MISRRNFLAIFLMMFVILFLCQFSQVMRENLNQSNNDEYDHITFPTSDDEWSQEKALSVVAEDVVTYGVPGSRNIIYIGDIDSEVGVTVSQWCRLIKASLTVSFDHLAHSH